MNIREELLKEKSYSKTQALKVSAFACSSPKHFKELMQFFFQMNTGLHKELHGV